MTYFYIILSFVFGYIVGKPKQLLSEKEWNKLLKDIDDLTDKIKQDTIMLKNRNINK